MTTEPTPNEDGELRSETDQSIQQLILRINDRRHEGESRNDVIRRLLDETIEEVPIETVVKDVFNYFGHVASIAVDHVPPEEPTLIQITVYTGDVYDFVEDVPIHGSGRKRVVIETNDEDRFVVPFFIIATSDGPSGEMLERTPIYYSDSVLGAEPLPIAKGLERLRSKLGKSPQEIRAIMDDKRDGVDR